MANSVLFVTSMLYPFSTGTMGVFNYSLPKYLLREGWDIRVIAPKINKPSFKYPEEVEVVANLDIELSGSVFPCSIEAIDCDGVPVYLINAPYYFGRDELYGYEDEAERFSYFCKGVLEALPCLGFRPDILHCQDWHTGFIPFLLKYRYSGNKFYNEIKTVLTIHNLGYQGVFDNETCEFLDLSWEELADNGLDYYDQVNFLKAGIAFSDIITTVSPTYAKEIMTLKYGSTLEELLQSRSKDIFGVLCGLDMNINDPSTDGRLYTNYNFDNLEGKYINKQLLQRDLNLPVRSNTPIISILSRLKTEKGMDIVRRAFKELLKIDLQLVIVSNGDKAYEDFFKKAASTYPDKVSFVLYDNDFAYRAYAGSDIFLMPSSYEPCGIGQLIALRYGAVPIVRQVGGLNDTIHDFNEDTGEGNGFTFKHYNSNIMLYTIRKALSLYQRQDLWRQVVKNGMKEDHGWNCHVSDYANIYMKALERPAVQVASKVSRKIVT